MTLPFNVIAIVMIVRYFLSGSFSDFCRQKVEHKSANKTAQSSEFPNFWITSLNDLEFSSGLWSSLQKGCPTRERGSKVKKKEDRKAIESLPYVSDQSTCTPEDKKWGHCLRSLWSKPLLMIFFSTLMYGVIMYNLIYIYIERERNSEWKLKSIICFTYVSYSPHHLVLPVQHQPRCFDRHFPTLRSFGHRRKRFPGRTRGRCEVSTLTCFDFIPWFFL